MPLEMLEQSRHNAVESMSGNQRNTTENKNRQFYSQLKNARPETDLTRAPQSISLSIIQISD